MFVAGPIKEYVGTPNANPTGILVKVSVIANVPGFTQMVIEFVDDIVAEPTFPALFIIVNGNCIELIGGVVTRLRGFRTCLVIVTVACCAEGEGEVQTTRPEELLKP